MKQEKKIGVHEGFLVALANYLNPESFRTMSRLDRKHANMYFRMRIAELLTKEKK